MTKEDVLRVINEEIGDKTDIHIVEVKRIAPMAIDDGRIITSPDATYGRITINYKNFN